MVGSPVSGFVESVKDWLADPVLDRLVARVAYLYGLANSDRPDLVQETRIAVWELGLETSVSAALVVRIASNKAIDRVRRRLRRRARDEAAALVAFPAERNEELRHLMNTVIKAMPRQLQRFYELRYRQGLSQREVARALRLSRASVRRLDEHLRHLLAGEARKRSQGPTIARRCPPA